MNLKSYLELRRIPKKFFAEELGISKATIYNYLSGKRTPPAETIKIIEMKTKGQVTMEDFIEHTKKKRSHSHDGSTTDSASLDV